MNTESLSGRHVVITGATGGIGRELCLTLARLGADITMLVRDKNKGNMLKNKILNNYPNTVVNILVLDLIDITSVKYAIAEIKKYNGIDILIMNAGIYNVPIEMTTSGYNNVFQVNFVSHYYMIKELLPELRKKKNSTVLAVSSIAHNYSKIDDNDIDFSTHKQASKVYGNSKRFLTFALHELFKNEENVKLSIVHPGITLTKMTNHYPKYINWLVKFNIKLLFHSPKLACLNIIKGIYTPTAYLEWIGPSILNIWGKPKKKKLKTCSTEESEKIFSIAEDCYSKIRKN